MKKLTLLVAMLTMVLLASAPVLSQTPNRFEASPVHRTEAVQIAGDTEVAQPTATSEQEAAPSSSLTAECAWYSNPERGWGWDYWCYYPAQEYWELIFSGAT
jgi:hypothetical protein